MESLCRNLFSTSLCVQMCVCVCECECETCRNTANEIKLLFLYIKYLLLFESSHLVHTKFKIFKKYAINPPPPYAGGMTKRMFRNTV